MTSDVSLTSNNIINHLDHLDHLETNNLTESTTKLNTMAINDQEDRTIEGVLYWQFYCFILIYNAI